MTYVRSLNGKFLVMRPAVQLMIAAGLAVTGLYAWAILHPASAPLPGLPGLPTGGTASVGGQPGAGGAGGAPQGRGGRAALVMTAPVSRGIVNDRLTAIGSAQAARSVTLRPLAAGQIVSVEVGPGQRVEAGDILLGLDADDEKLEVERAQIALRDANGTLERLESLLSRNAVSSVEVERARLEVRRAELELRQAEVDLERRLVRAPFGGVTGILPVGRGDYVTPQDELLTLDDRSNIIAEFFVPERFAPVIAPGASLEAVSVARPGERHEGVVSAIDNRIDPQSRTLKVQASIPNPQDRLRPGMAFRITMRFEGQSHAAVPSLAVNWDSQGSHVWALREEKARRVGVRIVQRDGDLVLVDGPLEPGEEVVTEGVQSMREGVAVRVAGATDAPSGTGSVPARQGGGS